MNQHAPDGRDAPLEEGAAPDSLLRLQDWMKEHGVAGVELEFDGYGDDGTVDLRSVSPNDARHIEVDGEDFISFARHVGHEVLYSHRRGWEVDSGSNGTVLIGPDEATLNFGRYEQDLGMRDVDDLTGEDAARMQALMRTLKIDRIELECSGCSDEGTVRLRSISPEVAREIDVGHGKTLADLVIGFGHHAVSHLYRGWETNEGGAGTVTITPDEATLHMGFYREETVFDPPLRLVRAPAPDAPLSGGPAA